MVTIVENNISGVMVLNIDGKLTGSENYNFLSNKIIELLKTGHKLFVFNMAGVINADSTGIGELIVCLKRIKEKGGELKLSNLSQKLESLIRVTNLERIFEIYTDERAALHSLGH